MVHILYICGLMAKMISTFLSLLILLGSSGIAYSQHFCGGQEVLAEVTVGHKELSCGMAMEENGCCDNHSTKVKIENSYAAYSQNFQFVNNLESLLPVFDIEYVYVDYIQNNKFYIDYSPPPIDRDFNILYDTFLI